MVCNFCNLVKHLMMDDTISCNASPVRLDLAHSANGVCSSMNCFNSDEKNDTDDDSVAEYKLNFIKISGNNGVLVRVAQQVLDEYFSSFEFMSSTEAAEALEATSLVTPFKTPCTPLFCLSKFMTGNRLPLAVSGISVNYAPGQNNNTGDGNGNGNGDGKGNGNGDGNGNGNGDGDAKGSSNQSSLTRAHRTHFLRNEIFPKSKVVRKLFEKETF